MRKRFLSVMLALSMLVSFMSIIANAETKYGDYLYYAINSDNTAVTITDCDESATEVVIPNEIDGLPVTSIGTDAFCDCRSLTNVIIPDSVTNIGIWAFFGCSSLTSISIPYGITIIDDAVFANCDSLTSVSIPDSVVTIYDSAFEYCTNLTSITIPDSVTAIGERAFLNCTGLTSITIPNSITTIGDYAIQWCDSLTDVYYSGTEAQWKAISIGEQNDSLRNAVVHYSGITPTPVPTPTSTSTPVPTSTPTITPTPIPTSTPSAIQGYLTYTINSANTAVTITGCDKSVTEAVIPNEIDGVPVTSIGSQAFKDCSRLTSITVPNDVISIGVGAFYNCSSLTNITIPDSVTSIGGYAFGGCSSLTSITIPDGVTTIGSQAFYNCSSLINIDVNSSNQYYSSIDGNLFSKDKKTLIKYALGKTDTNYTIPDSVTTIGVFAFHRCNSLESITISDGVTSVDHSAFLACRSLTDVYYSGTETQWAAISIGENNHVLRNAVVHYSGVTSTPTPMVEPTSEPTSMPTVEPTSTPTPTPTAEPTPTPYPITTAEIARTDTETDTAYTFEVTPETSYENCFVYAAVYDETGVLLGLNRVPLETTDKTTVSVNKADNSALAKVLLWADTLQPIISQAKSFTLK